MAIFKKPAGAKRATLRQGIYWSIYGFIAGFYCWQPLLKISHRDESSILADFIQVKDGKADFIEVKKNDTPENDESKSESSS